jgi:hypothetical protein
MIEAGHYENNGDDFAVPFGSAVVEQSGEATAIGSTPEADAVPRRGKRNPDW